MSPEVEASLGENLLFADVPRVLGHADALAAQGGVSLAGVRRFDSAGAALLLELTRRARARGTRFVIRECPAQVRALLEFFSVSALLDLEPPSRHEA